MTFDQIATEYARLTGEQVPVYTKDTGQQVVDLLPEGYDHFDYASGLFDTFADKPRKQWVEALLAYLNSDVEPDSALTKLAKAHNPALVADIIHRIIQIDDSVEQCW